MALTNTRVTLRHHAEGALDEDVFEVVSQPVRDLEPGEALVANIYATVDPSQSRRLRQYANYAAPFAVGGLIQGYAVGQVIASRAPELKEGDCWSHFQGGWETHSIVKPLPASASPARMQRADPGLGPLTLYIGALASKGLPAWIAIKLIGKTRPGETVVVSAAAGAVGGTAGQLAKLYGARTVGIVGSARKLGYLRDTLGFDEGVDYRAEDFHQRLDAACPRGIDVYLENVGGAVGLAVMERMRVHGRFAICGLVAEYEFDEPPPGPNLFVTIRRGFLVHGFLANHFDAQYREFRDEMIDLIRSGSILLPEDIVFGLENAGAAMLGMLRGDNLGQRFIQIAPDPYRPA